MNACEEHSRDRIRLWKPLCTKCLRSRPQQFKLTHISHSGNLSCLTGIGQEDILGNKISEAYSVFGSSPSANKSGNEYWFYCDIHLPTGFINNRPVNSHHIWRISPTIHLEPVSPLIHTTVIKIIIRFFVVKILQLIKQFGNCLIDYLSSCRSVLMSQTRYEAFALKPNGSAEESSHHPGSDCSHTTVRLTVVTEQEWLVHRCKLPPIPTYSW